MQIIERYTNFTQNYIKNGLLQTALVAEDPNSALQIVDAFFPVRDPNEPTEPPITEPPAGSPPGPAGEESSNTGAIVGGIFGGLFLCAFFVGVGWYSNKMSVDPQPLDLDPEDVDGNDSDQEDQEDNAFDAFGANFKDPNEEIEEKTTLKKKTKVFGFGKTQKKENEAGAVGLTTVFSDDSSSARDNDFGKYGFEDPDAVIGKDEDAEDEDDAGSKEELFDSKVSPAWGISETAFGSSWGAGGSDDLVNDFFGKSIVGSDLKVDVNKAEVPPPAASGGEAGENMDDENNADDYEESIAQSQSSFESSEDGTYESNTEQGELALLSGTFDATQNEPDNSSSADQSEEGEEIAESKRSGKSSKSGEDDEDDEDDVEDSVDGLSFVDSSVGNSSRTSTSGERQKRIEYRAQVNALVRIVLPDQAGKVGEMMEQFRGREPELVSILQNMQERSATQRARAAVHRSKTRPARTETRAGGSYAGAENMIVGASEGSAAGTAAIAAASLPIPAGGFDEAIPEENSVNNNNRGGFVARGAFQREEEEISFYSREDDEDGSYSDEGASFADDQDGNYDDDGSYDDDPSQDLNYDDDGRQDRSNDDDGRQDRSNDDDGRQDRSNDDDGRQDRSNDDGDSQDRSYDDDGRQDRSNDDVDSQDRSYDDGDSQDRSYDDGDSRGSFYSGDDLGSQDQSAFDGDDRGPKNQSFRDDGNSQGSFGQDGSRGSYSDGFDDEGQSFGDDDGGSRSYHSGERSEDFDRVGFAGGGSNHDDDNNDGFGGGWPADQPDPFADFK